MTGGGPLDDVVRQSADLIAALADEARPKARIEQRGAVRSVGAGVAVITGLQEALADELVIFESGEVGIATDLATGLLSVVLLGAGDGIAVGQAVRRTGRVASVPVGEALLGRAVDALGRPIDGKGAIATETLAPVEAPAPPIIDRAAITRPLTTGIKAIDAAVPIGRGQRELIVGDRQTGKTSIAVDSILAQADSEVVCVYCAIGQRGDAVARVLAALDRHGMRQRTIVLATGGETAPGLKFIAPFAATAMAEYFVHQGRDALIIYDDLTRHARAYRELSLLLRRPPGREAYPGDIFYLHARLLERAGQLSEARGGGSLTALPIVETQAENLAAYIPTNLISITDGQVYLSPRLVQKGQFPAVDLGKSVSRVGAKAQTPAFRAIAGDLRITMSQFEELESFARFGTRLDDDTKQRLTRGRAVRAALAQNERQPLPPGQQILLLIAALDGALDGLAENEVGPAADRLLADVFAEGQDAWTRIEARMVAGERLSQDDRAAIAAAAKAGLGGDRPGMAV